MGFTALVIGAILAFGLLSAWQWSRAQERQSERIALAEAVAAQPVALPGPEGLLAAQSWQSFTATGSYRPGSQTLARLRYLDGTNGFWALGALDLLDGRTIWVSRGWLPATGPATVAPPSPPLPTGRVTIVGSWLPFEESAAERQQGMPAGMVVALAPGPLSVATAVDSTIPGFLQATQVDDPGLRPVPAPEVDEGRNISYAVQWLIFAAVALVGWWSFLRREAQSPETSEIGTEPALSHPPI